MSKIVPPQKGEIFGKWEVIGPSKKNKHERTQTPVKCICGTESVVVTSNLLLGRTQGCKKCANRTKRPGDAGLTQVFLYYKKNARTRGIEFTLDKEIFRTLTQKTCFYCGSTPNSVCISTNKDYTDEGRAWSSYTYNGLDRIDNTKGYTRTNVVTCCQKCNYMKHKHSAKDFLEHVLKIVSQMQEAATQQLLRRLESKKSKGE